MNRFLYTWGDLSFPASTMPYKESVQALEEYNEVSDQVSIFIRADVEENPLKTFIMISRQCRPRAEPQPAIRIGN
jgi:hypothetical protein